MLPLRRLGPYLAEMVGAFALVFAGCGAIVVDATSHGQITHVGVAISFGLVIGVMIYATGHISGAHLNPAVTLAFALTRHFPLARVPRYWLAQLLGAASAALVLRWLFGDVGHLGATLPAGSDAQMKQRVLILCMHNSARSQMAEGFLRHLAGDRFEVFSAGTEKTAVRPEAIEAMRKRGIDISRQESKILDQFVAEAIHDRVRIWLERTQEE